MFKYLVIGLVLLAVVGAAAGGGSGSDSDPAVDNNPPAVDHKATPPAKAKPALSSGRQNALRSAKDYLDTAGFSKKGLVDQMKFEGFSRADAAYAASHAGADWNQEAVESAQDYLATTSFSRSGLTDQLTFEGFTPEQAAYGVDRAY